MKNIFKKTTFPDAPGGDRYKWKEAETIFEVPRKGRYLIAITASAKNSQQNGMGDDDDLRVTLNDFPFGQYEVHQEMVSWKGFGTSAAWDGASLKGATKTIYFFVELEKGEQKLVFFVDEKPKLKSVEVFELNRKNDFTLKNLRPPENIATDRDGIPWTSFVFLRVHPKGFKIIANCLSASQKNGTDGDNIKVIINGKILPNPDAPTSRTYKNFYFSGDQMQGQSKTLELKPEDLDFTENAMELWYDETPILEKLQINFFAHEVDYLKTLEKAFIKDPEGVRQKELKKWQWRAAVGKKTGLKYSSKLLLHSLQENPPEVVFESNDSFVTELKKDKKNFKKVLNLIEEKLRKGELEGEMAMGGEGDEINFGNRLTKPDLYLAIHGIKKISYKATQQSQNSFKVDITLHDYYNFEPTNWLKKRGDKGEKIRMIRNYPIRIKLREDIKF